MTDLTWTVRITDGCATDAALAHAAALGLREIVDRFRFADPGNVIPAPGAADLPDEIHAHALDAIHAAATAHILAETLAEPGGSEADADAFDQAVTRAQDASLAAQQCLRRLAQIGLGVAQHSYDGDDVELIERTMIGVFSYDPDDTPVAADAFPIVGRTRDEVSVELAGVIARLICELTLAGTPDGLDDEVDEDLDDWFGFMLVADGLDPFRVGVTPTGGVVVGDVRYPAPVTITEVTTAILRRITAVDPGAVGRITVDWEFE